MVNESTSLNRIHHFYLIYFLNSHRYCHKSISSFNYLIKRSIGLQNIIATLTTNVVSQFKTLETLLLVQLLDTVEFGKLRKILLQKQEDYPTTFLRYWIHLYTKWFMNLRIGKVLSLEYLSELGRRTGFFYSMWAPNHYILVDEEKKLREIHLIKEGAIAFKWEVFSMDEYDFGGTYPPESLKKPTTESPKAQFPPEKVNSVDLAKLDCRIRLIESTPQPFTESDMISNVLEDGSRNSAPITSDEIDEVDPFDIDRILSLQKRAERSCQKAFSGTDEMASNSSDSTVGLRKSRGPISSSKEDSVQNLLYGLIDSRPTKIVAAQAASSKLESFFEISSMTMVLRIDSREDLKYDVEFENFKRMIGVRQELTPPIKAFFKKNDAVLSGSQFYRWTDKRYFQIVDNCPKVFKETMGLSSEQVSPKNVRMSTFYKVLVIFGEEGPCDSFIQENYELLKLFQKVCLFTESFDVNILKLYTFNVSSFQLGSQFIKQKETSSSLSKQRTGQHNGD